MVLKKIGVGSAAKLCGFLYALLGLIFGALVSVAALIDIVSGSEGRVEGFLFGIGSIIILPIVYGVLGLIFGLIGAALYNLAAGMVGGLEMKVVWVGTQAG